VKKINPRVTDVRPKSDYTLLLIFTNDEQKIFDVKPYPSVLDLEINRTPDIEKRDSVFASFLC
jgi:hypothetical protein